VGKDVDIEGLGPVTIRPARPDEAGLLARFHRATHPGAFLPVLGERFLVHLYRGLVTDPDAVAVVAERDGEIIGYATGVMSMSGFYRRFFLRHGVAAGLAVLPRLLEPGVVRKITETARYPEQAQEQGLPDAEFTSLAVDQRLRSRHLGGLLSDEIIAALARRGADAVRGTVNEINAPMNRMMQRIGFQQVGRMSLHDGSFSNLYVIRTRPETRTEVDGAVIRGATLADVRALADLHARGISRGFLPRLGRPLLELLYRSFVEDPGAVVVVAERDGRVVGFSAGVVSVSRFYRTFARRHGLRAVALIAPLLVRPDLLRGVLETARYPWAAAGLPEAEWVSAAVAPDHRTRGLGEHLARTLVDALCARGAADVRVTVSADNQRIARLLGRMGWERRARITLHGRRPSDVYVIACRSS
jgi:ribosomal protein S18 acetylase RimI-like enzyme